jgi:hypothetical protein
MLLKNNEAAVKAYIVEIYSILNNPTRVEFSPESGIFDICLENNKLGANGAPSDSANTFFCSAGLREKHKPKIIYSLW